MGKRQRTDIPLLCVKAQGAAANLRCIVREWSEEFGWFWVGSICKNRCWFEAWGRCGWLKVLAGLPWMLIFWCKGPNAGVKERTTWVHRKGVKFKAGWWWVNFDILNDESWVILCVDFSIYCIKVTTSIRSRVYCAFFMCKTYALDS